MHDNLSWQECEALYGLFQHPGFKVLQDRLRHHVETTLTMDLRSGGKEAHDRNIGRIRGVEELFQLFSKLKEESILKAKEG